MSLHREEHQNGLNQEKKNNDEALGKVAKFQQHMPNVLCFYV